MGAIHIFGMHEGYGPATDLILNAGKTGWIVDTIALKNTPFSKDYSGWTSRGIDTICRLNWGYDPDGTIPAPELWDEAIKRASAFVSASKGVTRFIVGNEINMPWEWPNHVQITLDQYVDYYGRMYAAIKQAAPNAIVIPQAFCPWNDRLKYPGNERGDWVKAQGDMLERLQGKVDAIALHVYSHGLNPSKIHDEAKMQAPFTDRYYNFFVYREFMGAIPASMRSLPVFITEANGQEEWRDNTGWVKAAYAEIDWWNQQPGNQQIYALCLYRWPCFDKHGIEDKDGAKEDFKGALQHDYRYRQPSPQKPVVTAPVVQSKPVRLTVVAKAGVRVRNGPGIGTTIARVAPFGSVLESDGTTQQADGLTWYKVNPSGWAAQSANGITLLKPIGDTEPIQSADWEKAIAFVLEHEGGYVPASAGDPGGETNYGISKRSHPTLDIAKLTIDDAKEIYRLEYWIGSGSDKMQWPLNVVHFDFAVNAGVGRANRTLAESNSDVSAYLDARVAFYKSLSTFPKYGKGWLRRVDDLRKLIGLEDKPQPMPSASLYMATVQANIRRTPGHLNKPKSDIIGTLRVGEIVSVTGETANADGHTWAQIDRNGRKFWTVQEFLQVFEEKKIKGGSVLFPVSPVTRISQTFGERPEVYAKIIFSGVPLKGHNGVDFACPVGHDIVAVDAGTVTKCGWDSTGYGNHIQIRHAWGDTVYAHLSQVLVEEGETVERGQHIAESGDTGWSSGPHLHFGLRIAPYLTTDGWGGYIDPLPYLNLA